MSVGDVRAGFVVQAHTGRLAPSEIIDRGAYAGFDFAEVSTDGAPGRSELDGDVTDPLGENHGVEENSLGRRRVMPSAFESRSRVETPCIPCGPRQGEPITDDGCASSGRTCDIPPSTSGTPRTTS